MSKITNLTARTLGERDDATRAKHISSVEDAADRLANADEMIARLTVTREYAKAYLRSAADKFNPDSTFSVTGRLTAITYRVETPTAPGFYTYAECKAKLTAGRLAKIDKRTIDTAKADKVLSDVEKRTLRHTKEVARTVKRAS